GLQCRGVAEVARDGAFQGSEADNRARGANRSWTGVNSFGLKRTGIGLERSGAEPVVWGPSFGAPGPGDAVQFERFGKRDGDHWRPLRLMMSVCRGIAFDGSRGGGERVRAEPFIGADRGRRLPVGLKPRCW